MQSYSQTLPVVKICEQAGMDNLWYPPPSNEIKINIHGVIEEVPTSIGNMNAIGIIARNHEGEFF